MTRECSIPGCERPARARGWCRPHYEVWRRHGDPLAAGVFPNNRQAQTRAAREAFAAKFETPEEKSEHFRRMAVSSHQCRVVLSGEEAQFLQDAFALIGTDTVQGLLEGIERLRFSLERAEAAVEALRARTNAEAG